MNTKFTVDLIDLNAKLILTTNKTNIIANYEEYVGDLLVPMSLSAILTENDDNYESINKAFNMESLSNNLWKCYKLLRATEQVMRAINLEYNNDTFLIFG